MKRHFTTLTIVIFLSTVFGYCIHGLASAKRTKRLETSNKILWSTVKQQQRTIDCYKKLSPR